MFHTRKRKNFALKYKDEKLNNIRFAYESYFQLSRNTKGKWCHKNEQAFIRKLNPNYSLMIQGCICINVKSEIAICEQEFKINSQTYIEILNNYLIPLISTPEIQFLKDNAPSYHSNFIKD